MPSFLLNPLLTGFLLDALLGDPSWLPHPIRLFGAIISKGENKLNQGHHQKWKGALLSGSLVIGTWGILFGLMKLLQPIETVSFFVSTLLIFFGLANRSLLMEAWQVEKKMSHEGVEYARDQLARIVGRDTATLNPQQIRTAVLETLSENLSDGVIAPLFYYALGGVPLLFAYKMINTLDSMIGYKNSRYKDFGWFAARTDDLANWIPARLTALLMVISSASFRGFTYLFRYGNHHNSPNSGFPESALAGILHVRLGGPNTYGGILVEKPYIGDNARTIRHADITKACLLNGVVSIIAVGLITWLLPLPLF
jgi:adenosylcobinamide-phosphate synthase